MSAQVRSVDASVQLWRYRGAVVARTVLAFVGGYMLSAAFAAALGLVCVRWAGLARTEAVTVSTMLSFVVLTVAVLWVFACSSTKRAYVGIAVPTVILVLLAWLLSGGQA